MRQWMIVLLLVCVGCVQSPHDPQVVALNKQRLSGIGEDVGTLPDGRVVYRYEIDRGSDPSHFVYMIVNQPTITMNTSEKHGKVTVNRSVVIIDGVKYVPAEEGSPNAPDE